jgi:hypothetical protein
MNGASFDGLDAKCDAFGVDLLKPRGLRKYFILQKGLHRVRLAKTWEEARLRIGKGMQLLFDNYKPPSPPSTDGIREDRDQ